MSCFEADEVAVLEQAMEFPRWNHALTCKCRALDVRIDVSREIEADLDRSGDVCLDRDRWHYVRALSGHSRFALMCSKEEHQQKRRSHGC